MTGKIARVTDRGFGFITPDEGDKDVFFHAKDLVDVEFNDLSEGDAVSFDIVDGPKGPAASNVQRAGDAPAATDDAATDDTPAEETTE